MMNRFSTDHESQRYFSPECLYVQLCNCVEVLDRTFSERSGGLLGDVKGTSKPLLSRFKIKKDKSKQHGKLEDFTQVFITKWVDYSNKHGFGTQFSDGSVSVRFNDCTKISLTPDKRYVLSPNNRVVCKNP